METSSFHFKNHQEFQGSIYSSDRGEDVEPEIESITGRGIKHLCSELLELKEVASEELQENILAECSAFVRILEEVKGVKNELLQLENHFIAHQTLIKNLMDDIYPKLLSEDIMNSTFEDEIDVLLSSPSELEVHINDVSEKLDIYLSENQVEEALDLLESSEEYFQSVHFEGHCPPSDIMLYKSFITKRKSSVIHQLTQIAQNSKTAGMELHRALSGIRRLGDDQLAIYLLLKQYYRRISAGTYNLQWSRSSSNERYIRELARFVFSMISHAARSFVKLCGEDSSYASELEQWACEETKSFTICLEKYVRSISEMSGGLSTAIEVVQSAVSYCSLLENHNLVLVLQPYLIRNLCPCMEEVLLLHINHFKKVIAIFSSSDPWVLDRYLVPGLFGRESSTQAVGQQLEYCLLTSSGRKFMTLLQAIVEDISPLIGLHMESLVISGLAKLFSEYLIILERVLTFNTSVIERENSRIKPAESVTQQVSILANLSTLVHVLSILGDSIFRSTIDINSNSMENHSATYQPRELDDFLLLIEESCNKLRHHFCQQFISKVLSTHQSHEITLSTHNNEKCDANASPNPMPSRVLQVLFIELRKLEQLADGNVLEVDWLMGLLREMMEFIFIWVSQNKNINSSAEDNKSSEFDDSKQFVLDVQFLMEITMYGGYFTNDPLLLVSLMKSTFISARLDPFRDVDNDGWAIDVATKTIQMLLDIGKREPDETKLSPKDKVVSLEEALHEADQISPTGVFSQEDDSCSSDNDRDAEEAKSEIAIDLGTVSVNIEESLDHEERKIGINDNTEYEKESDAEHDGVLCPAYPCDETVGTTNIEMQGTEDSIRKANKEGGEAVELLTFSEITNI